MFAIDKPELMTY